MNIGFVTSTRNKMYRELIILNMCIVLISGGVRVNVNKCCPIGSFVAAKKNCVKNTSSDTTFSEIKVYDEDLDITVKLFQDAFSLIPNTFRNKTLKREFLDVIELGYNVYLIENGVIQAELPNTYDRWTQIQSEKFCIDVDSRNGPEPRFWALLPDRKSSTYESSDIYITASTIVSCFFMLLVLVVYIVLPELQNLCGMILMAYITSLLMAFLLLIVLQLPTDDLIKSYSCVGLTSGIYFFFLAAFCWMNVMSYDMWWTFSSIMNSRQQSRGDRFKFLMYCLYAWGLPLLMTIFLVLVNTFEDDMKRMPWFITPRVPAGGCFLQGGVKMLYLYIPMLILIICNWIFYLMTAFNIWQLNRGTAVLDSHTAANKHAHRAQTQRLIIYLKLSVVMGLSWVLEIVSFQYPGYNVWFLSDFYNSLIGVAMFLIFVCKKKIWRKLCTRFNEKKTKLWASKNTCTSKIYSSQENIALQSLVSLQPNGLNGR